MKNRGFLQGTSVNKSVAEGFQKESQRVDWRATESIGRMAKNAPGKAVGWLDQTMGKNFSRTLGVFGVGLIMSQFIEAGVKHIKDRNIRRKGPKLMKKMLEKYPNLLEEDPQEVATLWETLYNTAPHAAEDPTMAAAFIKQNIDREVVTQHGGPPLDTYKLLSEIEKRRTETGPNTESYVNQFIKMLGAAKIAG